MTRFLLTGGGGFVGQWIAKALIERRDDVMLAGMTSPSSEPGVLSRDERGAVRWIDADMRSADDVEAMIDAAQPETVIHLAGVAFPPVNDRDPATAYDVNTLGCVRLLHVIGERRSAGTLDPLVLVIGTGLQYGLHAADEMPLRESAEQRPSSVYAASKAAQEIVARRAHRANGLRVICTRSFNHSGVGHGGEYLIPSLVRRVRAIRRDGAGSLRLGNDATRDYLHVSDVVAAYLALVERGVPGEVYNVSSGTGVSARRLAEDILNRTGVTADISTDDSLVRPTEIPILVGSSEKLIRATGWTPRKTYADIIDDLLNAATD